MSTPCRPAKAPPNIALDQASREIDTRFRDGQFWGPFIDGLRIVWTDPLGATNTKWSYLNVALDINHEAHVEAVEGGTHLITIPAQAGCNVGEVYLAGNLLRTRGPQTVKVSISPSFKGDTIFVDVVCQ